MSSLTVEDVRSELESAGLGDLTVCERDMMIVVADSDGEWWGSNDEVERMRARVEGVLESYDEDVQIVCEYLDDVDDVWEADIDEEEYAVAVWNSIMTADTLNAAFGAAFSGEE
jgi:hypothetical protein